MVVLFSTTLAISIVGLITLISLKRWEMSGGRVVGAAMRPAVGEFFHRCVVFVERVLPALALHLLMRGWAALRAFARAVVAWGVLVVERVLESTLHGIRRKTSVPHARQAKSSDFLREVAEHKKKLLEVEDRAIYED
jgi:hypothetical protein